jgi:photosystem II stability/assembly factor-like uncharacterized protein
VGTDAAAYVSRDGGENWSPCVEAPGELCLAVAPTFANGGPVLVGLSRGGVYRSTDGLASWQVANEGLTARRLTGLALSPAVATDGRVVAFGAGEGVVQSDDGGVTWSEADDGLPSPQVNDAAIGVTPDGEYRLYATLPEGTWTCPWRRSE